MSQIAIIEIENTVIDLAKIKNASFDESFCFDINSSLILNFFKSDKTYINIINDLESRDLDMLVFDHTIDLRDFKKIYEVVSPLFKAVKCLMDKNIKSQNIKLYISEDCNVEDDDFIKIDIEGLDFEKTFIRYISSHDIIKTNCFPPIMFNFI